MTFEHKPGSFSLFKNDKGDNEQRPDYRGEGKDMAGRDIEVAAWLKTGSKGKFMSCRFKLKEPAQQQRPPETQKQQANRAVREMPDDIPF